MLAEFVGHFKIHLRDLECFIFHAWVLMRGNGQIRGKSMKENKVFDSLELEQTDSLCSSTLYETLMGMWCVSCHISQITWP